MIRSSSSFDSAIAAARSSTSLFSAFAWIRACASRRRRCALCVFAYSAITLFDTPYRSASSR
jgi:hypothetical protein